MGAVLDPRLRKRCPLRRPDCGHCQNCRQDAWSRTWRSLLEEDKEWVKDQFARTLVWAGTAINKHHLEYLVRPSLTRWVLK